VKLLAKFSSNAILKTRNLAHTQEIYYSKEPLMDSTASERTENGQKLHMTHIAKAQTSEDRERERERDEGMTYHSM